MTPPINECRISCAPPSVYYIPDFITPTEERVLVEKVLGAPKPKWVHLKNRRLQNWGNPHTDGPAYLPTVATVSLSSHCVLEFYKIPEDQDNSSSRTNDSRGQEPEFALLVQPRSLLVLKEDIYNKYMHGIREVTSDDLNQGNILNLPEAAPEVSNHPSGSTLAERGTRISLTFRIVQKTLSKKLFLRR
ncbi:Alpha-ketoglutarate-dependent dioxygenase alkB 6 [Mortierella antarctica]|nr:Alpha-ketoglutarate-dependent dioxygenase alkB 6 [Mortierella alpina]KAF9985933.1 Alpha-ketoglutarate-dependent dioxygenase alkB 6 [Mortierella antarctica]